MVRRTSLALAVIGGLGMAAGPSNALGQAAARSEVVSALAMGVLLILLAVGVRRTPVGRE